MRRREFIGLFGGGIVASAFGPSAARAQQLVSIGVSFLATAIVAKRLDLLHAIVPNAAHIAILVNPNNLDASLMAKEVAAAERALGLRLQVQMASTEGDIDAAFANFAREHADALLISGDAFFNAVRRKLIALSERNSLPSIFDVREGRRANELWSKPDRRVATGWNPMSLVFSRARNQAICRFCSRRASS